MINFIRKPSLGNTENDKFSELFNFLKDDEIKQKVDIIKYFVNDAKSINSKYDLKILEFLEEDIKTIIENIACVHA